MHRCRAPLDTTSAEKEVGTQPMFAGSLSREQIEGVIQSEVKKSTLADPKVENCMLLKIRDWKFPKPPGGGIVDVTYPFVFQVP